jgi:hypothetical protein
MIEQKAEKCIVNIENFRINFTEEVLEKKKLISPK